MSFGIVITTFNRAEILARLLQRLSLQTDSGLQVVVVINGSTHHTENMLSMLQLHFHLQGINTHCQAHGLAVARYRGIPAAAGRARISLDDDSFPNPGLVAAHKRSVTARVINGAPQNSDETGNERMTWKMRELARLPALPPMTIPQLRRDWPNAYPIEKNICLLREDPIAMGLLSRLKRSKFRDRAIVVRDEFPIFRYQHNPFANISQKGKFVGTDSLSDSRKRQEILHSGLMRTTLTRPKHYSALVAWARAEGVSETLPPSATRVRRASRRAR